MVVGRMFMHHAAATSNEVRARMTRAVGRAARFA